MPYASQLYQLLACLIMSGKHSVPNSIFQSAATLKDEVAASVFWPANWRSTPSTRVAASCRAESPYVIACHVSVGASKTPNGVNVDDQ